jgi:hypothetical protein
MTIVSGVAVLMMYSMAKLREGYLAFVNGTASNDFEAVLNGGVNELVASSFDLPLDAGGYALIIINLAVFLAAAVASFARHDPHPDYERVYRDLERADREVYKSRKQYESAVVDEERAFDRKITHLDRQIAATAVSEQTTRQELTNPNQRCVEVVKRVASVLELRVQKYISGNLRGRNDGKTPGCFKAVTWTSVYEAIQLGRASDGINNRIYDISQHGSRGDGLLPV